MTEAIFDVGLIVLLVAIGAWIVLVRDTVTAVIVFIAYGLLLSIAWIRLAAIDVALTEAAIGSGVTGMLLIAAATRLRHTERQAREVGPLTRIATALTCVVLGLGLGSLALFAPLDPPTLAPAAMENIGESGLGNPVAGVLFVFRAFDTLLEKVVLILALIGIWSFAPDKFWGGVPGFGKFTQRGSVLVFLAQTLPPFGIMFAVYMTWVGAYKPGGAFQGGTVLAAMWILVLIAGRWRVPPVSSPKLRLMLLIGPVGFLAIGFVGFFFADAFLDYPEGYAKPLIIAVEFALTLSIGIALGLLAAGPPQEATHR